MGLDDIKRFIVDGSYMELKKEEERLSILKNLIREEQDSFGLKRSVWEKTGVVGEFQIYKVYEYNHEELKALLYNVGLLPLVSYIKSDDLSEEELGRVAHMPVQSKRYLRFTPTNIFNQHRNTALFANMEEVSLLDKVAIWKGCNNKFERLNTKWQREKLRALISPELKTSKRLTFECGTFSVLDGPKKYRTDMVLELFDEKMIYKCAKVNIDRIDEIIASGFLKKHELNGIRKVVDLQRRYILMTIQKEKVKKDYWNSKLERLSKLSQEFGDG